jgi:acetyl-CoA C-acetyltransferase
MTSSKPAAPAWKPPSSWPTRSPGPDRCGIAGGVDTTSDAPIGVNEKLRKMLLDLSRAKTPAQRLAVAGPIRPGMLISLNAAAQRRAAHRPVHGRTCRADGAVNGASPRSPGRAGAEEPPEPGRPYESGFFTDLMTPFQGLTRDNNLRADLTLEKLRQAQARVRPQGRSRPGHADAGNSTPLTDGASAVLLASEEWAAERNLPVLAYLTFSEVAAVDFFTRRKAC